MERFRGFRPLLIFIWKKYFILFNFVVSLPLKYKIQAFKISENTVAILNLLAKIFEVCYQVLFCKNFKKGHT